MSEFFKTTQQREEEGSRNGSLRDTLDDVSANRLSSVVIDTLDFQNHQYIFEVSPESFCDYLCLQLGRCGKGLPIADSEEYDICRNAEDGIRRHIELISRSAKDLRNFLDWYAQYFRQVHMNAEYVHMPEVEKSAVAELNNSIRQINNCLQHEQCVFRIVWDSGYGFAVHRIGSEALRKSAVEPALALLRDCTASSALAEYEEGLRAWAQGDNRKAILHCSHAFEATIKFLIAQSGISIEKDNPRAIIQKLVSETSLVPKEYQSVMESLINVLQGVVSVRNQTPGVGHGAGPYAPPINNETAEYAINLAGANILFLLRRIG